MKFQFKSRQHGFSLFELLAVITIIGLIAALSVPALIPAIQSRSLNAVSDEFEQALNNARQLAMAEDVVVDVEMIGVDEDGSGTRFRAYQFWKWLPSGERVPVDKISWLESSFEFLTGYSTLLESGVLETESGRVLEMIENPAEVVRFSIFPNGETNLPSRLDSDSWYVTIASTQTGGDLDSNFVCFQVNQTNAHVTRYRP